MINLGLGEFSGEEVSIRFAQLRNNSTVYGAVGYNG